MNNVTVEKTIQNIYEELDYSVNDFEDRNKILNDILEKYSEEIEMFSYYDIVEAPSYSEVGLINRINNLRNALSNYLLYSENQFKSIIDNDKIQTAEEYTFYPDDETSHGSVDIDKIIDYVTDEEVDIDIYVNPTLAIKDVEHKIDEDLKEYAEGYRELDRNTRDIIEQLSDVFEIYRQLGYRTEQYPPATAYVNGVPRQFTYEEYRRLRKSIGYTVNNSILIDMDIMYLYQISNPSMNRAQKYYQHYGSEDINIDFELTDYKDVMGLIKILSLKGWSKKFDNFFIEIEGAYNNIKDELSDNENWLYRKMKKGKDVEIYSIANVREKIYSGRELSKMRGVSAQYISQLFRQLSKKIAKECERIIESDYYLYEAKGTYKKCNTCKENKLLTDNYFYQDNNTADGYKTICIRCMKKQQRAKNGLI